MFAKRSRAVLPAALALAVALLSAGPSGASAPATSNAHARAVAAGELATRGYLVPDPAAFGRAKTRAAARAARAAGHAAPVTGAAVEPPRAGPSWPGLSDPRGTPSDSTGAIGPTRYVEMVNTRFAFYKRTGKLLSAGDLGTLTKFGKGYRFLTDPQVMWDPGTQRFYFVVLDADVAAKPVPNGIDFAYGFSRTPTPKGPASWCVYHLSFGYDDPNAGSFKIPDQPHLGDTADFVLWGANVFDLASFSPRFVGADVDWVRKPPAGTACPPASSLRGGLQSKLKTAAGTPAFGPTVARQVDTHKAGWVVAIPELRTGSGSKLALFEVTKNRNGTAHIEDRGRAISVGAFSFPANAPQKGGGSAQLDTSDARLTQAFAAIDPAHHSVAVWTQHAVEGGAGSEIRWYEIDPGHASLFQHGAISDPNLFVFDGAISPDRVVRPGVAKFGKTMVVGFDTSSSSTDATIQMVSKVGDGPQSDFVLIHRSPAPEKDFSCRPTCRWGDYSGASPDPAANVHFTRGRVWLTGMWSGPGANAQDVDWRTWNWRARP